MFIGYSSSITKQGIKVDLQLAPQLLFSKIILEPAFSLAAKSRMKLVSELVLIP